MKDANWLTGVFSSESIGILKEKVDEKWNSVVYLHFTPFGDGENCGLFKTYESADSFFQSIEKDQRIRCLTGLYERYWRMTYSWTYLYYSWGVLLPGDIGDLFRWNIEFYRIVSFYGAFNKITWRPYNSVEDAGGTGKLADWTPVEMRFCVKVFYRNNWNAHKKELCSIMTNFME